ncbi:MAG: hypothetical protein ACREMR_09810, partial [Gemmatimonadales bacterium]
THPELAYEHRFLGPFVLGPGAEFRVDLRVARLASARGGSDVVAVDCLRIVDGTDAVHFARDYKVTLGGDSGFDDWIEITASMLETSQGPVLVVDESVNPSAPGTGESRQFFALVDGRLRPLTSRVSGYGNFAGLPAGQQPRSFRLLAGDRMEFRAWEGHFGIALPLELRFPGRPDAPPEGLALVLETDTTSGLTVLPVTETADIGPEYRGEIEQVTLYRSATGSTADTVLVRKNSRIEYGPAYGRAWLNLDARRDELGIGVDIARLRVVIDGKAGFIEEDDYEKVGLSQAS